MTGASLLRLSGTRSVMNDLSNYASAVQNFRTEFKAIPGDMANATSYWGIGAGTGSNAACYSFNQSVGVATCNGTGSGDIELVNPATAAADGTESYLAWKHLANAGLVSGAFTGRTASGGAGAGTVASTNAPSAKIDGLTYIIRGAVGCMSADATYFDGCYSLFMVFGLGSNSALHPAALFTPDEMYSMDKKVDDGLPGGGQLRTFDSVATCASSSTAYALSSNGKNCAGIYQVDPIMPN